MKRLILIGTLMLLLSNISSQHINISNEEFIDLDPYNIHR